MTIQEVIDALTAVPDARKSESLQIYVNGPISGYLETGTVETDEDEDFIAIQSVRMREVFK